MRRVVYQLDTVQDQQMLHRETEGEREREGHSWQRETRINYAHLSTLELAIKAQSAQH